MKKTAVVVMMAIASAVMSAQASIVILWGSGAAGFFGPDGANPIAPNNGSQVLVQLIWAGANATIDTVDLLNAGGGYVGGDDSVYATYVHTVSDNSDITQTYMTGAPGAQASGANPGVSLVFFARVFQDNTPANGEKYFDSTLFTATSYTSLIIMP